MRLKYFKFSPTAGYKIKFMNPNNDKDFGKHSKVGYPRKVGHRATVLFYVSYGGTVNVQLYVGSPNFNQKYYKN